MGQSTETARGIELFDRIKDRFVELRGMETYLQEASFAAQIIASNDLLLKSTAQSKQQAVINVANIGLSLSPVKKQAYLVPRYNRDKKVYECHLEPSYIGLMKLAIDTGSVRSMETQKVYENDEFTFQKGTVKEIKHVPAWARKPAQKKGKLIAVYSVATLLDGSLHVEDMDAEDLERVRNASETYVKWKAGERGFAPHKEWGDEMDRKAVIRRHCKTLPKSDRSKELLEAIALDEQGFNLDPKPDDPLKAKREQIRQALDFYQGEDGDTLRELCRNKLIAGEFNEEFANNMLKQLSIQTEV